MLELTSSAAQARPGPRVARTKLSQWRTDPRRRRKRRGGVLRWSVGDRSSGGRRKSPFELHADGWRVAYALDQDVPIVHGCTRTLLRGLARRLGRESLPPVSRGARLLRGYLQLRPAVLLQEAEHEGSVPSALVQPRPAVHRRDAQGTGAVERSVRPGRSSGDRKSVV